MPNPTEEQVRLSWDNVYRALVVDNKDPRKLGRVKIWCPDTMVHLKPEQGIWARPGNNYLGGRHVIGNNIENSHNYQGSCFIPPVNSWVNIRFEYGNPSVPVYIGACDLENSTVLPENQVGTNYSEKWTLYRSRAGRTVVISDDPDDERVSITGKKRLHNKVVSQTPVNKKVLEDIRDTGDLASVFAIRDNQSIITIDDRSNEEKILFSDYHGNYIRIVPGADQIDIYTARDINVLAKRDINIKAKRNINMMADEDINFECRNFNVNASKNISTKSGGRTYIQSKQDINILTEAICKLQSSKFLVNQGAETDPEKLVFSKAFEKMVDEISDATLIQQISTIPLDGTFVPKFIQGDYLDMIKNAADKMLFTKLQDSKYVNAVKEKATQLGMDAEKTAQMYTAAVSEKINSSTASLQAKTDKLTNSAGKMLGEYNLEPEVLDGITDDITNKVCGDPASNTNQLLDKINNPPDTSKITEGVMDKAKGSVQYASDILNDPRDASDIYDDVSTQCMSDDVLGSYYDKCSSAGQTFSEYKESVQNKVVNNSDIYDAAKSSIGNSVKTASEYMSTAATSAGLFNSASAVANSQAGQSSIKQGADTSSKLDMYNHLANLNHISDMKAYKEENGITEENKSYYQDKLNKIESNMTDLDSKTGTSSPMKTQVTTVKTWFGYSTVEVEQFDVQVAPLETDLTKALAVSKTTNLLNDVGSAAGVNTRKINGIEDILGQKIETQGTLLEKGLLTNTLKSQMDEETGSLISTLNKTGSVSNYAMFDYADKMSTAMQGNKQDLLGTMGTIMTDSGIGDGKVLGDAATALGSAGETFSVVKESINYMTCAEQVLGPFANTLGTAEGFLGKTLGVCSGVISGAGAILQYGLQNASALNNYCMGALGDTLNYVNSALKDSTLFKIAAGLDNIAGNFIDSFFNSISNTSLFDSGDSTAGIGEQSNDECLPKLMWDNASDFAEVSAGAASNMYDYAFGSSSPDMNTEEGYESYKRAIGYYEYENSLTNSQQQDVKVSGTTTYMVKDDSYPGGYRHSTDPADEKDADIIVTESKIDLNKNSLISESTEQLIAQQEQYNSQKSTVSTSDTTSGIPDLIAGNIPSITNDANLSTDNYNFKA